MIDYEGLARRAFDEPLGRDGMAALRVWADELEAKGDPRGALIAMEHALLAAPERHREWNLAMHALIRASTAPAFGELARLMSEPRTLVLDWRAGQLYGARLETARLEKALGLSTEALIELLVAAPVASTLRRLAIRTVTRGRALRACQWLANAGPSALEELVVGAELRSRHVTSDAWLSQNMIPLMTRYPDLRFLADRDMLISLPLTIEAAAIGDPRAPRVRTEAKGMHLRLLRDADPAIAAGRAVIGRALVNIDEDLRTAALHRLAELGGQAANALSQIGNRGWVAMRALAKISSRTQDADGEPAIDLQTRRTAGRALASLRAAR